MFNNTLIHVFATAMALASSGIVFGATVAPQTVEIGTFATVNGRLQVGCLNPSTQKPTAILHSLEQRVFVKEANDRLRPVERLMLVPSYCAVDLVRLAQVLPVDSKIALGGTFDLVQPAKVAFKLPLSSCDTIRVCNLTIDGVNIVKPAASEEGRIATIATQRILTYIHELHPFLADGPEAVVDSVEVITNDHALVTLHYTSGRTHQVIPGSTVKALVVLSGDDEIHVIEGAIK